jgi:hypothetical protein
MVTVQSGFRTRLPTVLTGPTRGAGVSVVVPEVGDRRRDCSRCMTRDAGSGDGGVNLEENTEGNEAYI